jgi:hypothetical protein
MTRFRFGLVVGVVAGIAATLVFQRMNAPTNPGRSRASALNGLIADGSSVTSTRAEAVGPGRNTPPAPHAAPRPAPVQPVRDAEQHLETIPISPGFERVLIRRPDSGANLDPAADLHAQIAAEGRDTVWADQAEEEIRTYVDGYLDQHGLDRHSIELGVVHCGVTICEIQTQGYQEDVGRSVRDWQGVMLELMQGPFSQDFHYVSTLVFSLENNRAGYVTFLNRKPKP